MKQLDLWQRCKFDPKMDDPIYKDFKIQIRNDTIKFIKDFIDVYAFEEERIFLCSDLPFHEDHTTLLLDSYGISHMLTIRPAESTAIEFPHATCLHIDMEDDFEEDDLVLHTGRMSDFIGMGSKDGTGVLIHSFEEQHIQLALSAYLMRSRHISVQSAFNSLATVKDLPEEWRETKKFVEPRLRLLKSCQYKLQRGNQEVEKFLKNRAQ